MRRPVFFTLTFRSVVAVLLALLFLAVCFWALEAARQKSAARALPPSVSSQPSHLPLFSLTVVVDAGHGGEDRGVCHFPENLIEKEINLDMAYRLQKGLQDQGASVFLTRKEDVFLTLDERARLANESDGDLFISLHVNRIPGHPECFGAQTFYFPTSEQGKRLAMTVQDELLKADPDNYRQALPGRFKVLRLSEMPGALVEIGFLTNERDRQLLQGDEYRDRVIEAIVTGIVRYVEETRAL